MILNKKQRLAGDNMNYWKEKIESEDFVLYYHGEDGWCQNDTYIIEFKDDNYWVYKNFHSDGYIIDKRYWNKFTEIIKKKFDDWRHGLTFSGEDMYDIYLRVKFPDFDDMIYKTQCMEIKKILDKLYKYGVRHCKRRKV